MGVLTVDRPAQANQRAVGGNQSSEVSCRALRASSTAVIHPVAAQSLCAGRNEGGGSVVTAVTDQARTR